MNVQGQTIQSHHHGMWHEHYIEHTHRIDHGHDINDPGHDHGFSGSGHSGSFETSGGHSGSGIVSWVDASEDAASTGGSEYWRVGTYYISFTTSGTVYGHTTGVSVKEATNVSSWGSTMPYAEGPSRHDESGNRYPRNDTDDTGSTETRPKNYTIKIWKRTA